MSNPKPDRDSSTCASTSISTSPSTSTSTLTSPSTTLSSRASSAQAYIQRHRYTPYASKLALYLSDESDHVPINDLCSNDNANDDTDRILKRIYQPPTVH